MILPTIYLIQITRPSYLHFQPTTKSMIYLRKVQNGHYHSQMPQPQSFHLYFRTLSKHWVRYYLILGRVVKDLEQETLEYTSPCDGSTTLNQKHLTFLDKIWIRLHKTVDNRLQITITRVLWYHLRLIVGSSSSQCHQEVLTLHSRTNGTVS